MSAALLSAEITLNPSFQYGNNDVSHLAASQFDWILGKNPFDICMMYGYGYTNYPVTRQTRIRLSNVKEDMQWYHKRDTGETDISLCPLEDIG